MRRVTRNGVIAVAAASGAMVLTVPAHADSTADGAATGSPGLISGNTIQLPVHVPVNACGNTVNVVGLLNPAAGNTCVNEGGGRAGVGPHSAADRSGAHRSTAPASTASGGSAARGGGKDAPGILSGNGLQLPIDLPVNVSGNSVSVVGIGNASVGNESVNTSGDRPHPPTRPTPGPSTPPKAHPGPQAAPHTPERVAPALARTGADQTLPAAAASAALVIGGAALYRRFRPRATS
ncbi:chaplin [Streptomyces sp. NPDC088794]|uniref:chaplin n=1 Tax=Streptomyces sp. NPDC088794 TaxID=3365902 RepID=UPI00383031EC